MKNEHLWAIVLSGGEGSRLRRFIRALRGREYPKQYCAIVGTRSMLRHTIDRVRMLFHADRVITVINADHRDYARAELSSLPDDNVIVQPFSRETGPGLALGLMLVHRRDPNAVVAVFPSDHFILEEQKFMDHVRYSLAFINTYREYLLMLGIEPTAPEMGYGWIEKGPAIFRHRGMGIFAVKRFWEKPDRSVIPELMAAGCLWNTLVLMGWVGEFLQQFRNAMPEVCGPLEGIRSQLGQGADMPWLGEVFGHLPSVNLSRSLLEPGIGHLAVMHVRGVYWSDWGEEQRIRHDVAALGLKTASIPPAGAMAMETRDQHAAGDTARPE